DFASEVVVTDRETGEQFERTIRVNEPLSYMGVTVYQASFDDGGSRVTLTGYPLDGRPGEPFSVSGVIGDTLQLSEVAGSGTAGALRFSALRPINVEELDQAGAERPTAFGEHVAAVTGSAVRENTS